MDLDRFNRYEASLRGLPRTAAQETESERLYFQYEQMLDQKTEDLEARFKGSDDDIQAIWSSISDAPHNNLYPDDPFSMRRRYIDFMEYLLSRESPNTL